MIFIAESGSTKCDAVFLNEDGSEVQKISTIGFNPYFHNTEFIKKELKKVPEIQKLGKLVTKVFFFGAGCSSPELNQKVVAGLKEGFPNAEIQVDHDLMASAYATYNGKPAISCILGTGSNTIYFDGKKITKGVSGLGYILGDEGSATYIGKKVLAAYLYRILPKHILMDFDATYNLSYEEIRERVYQRPNVNVFLGSFAPFAHKHIAHEFFYTSVYVGFDEFIRTQVLHFEHSREVSIHFVGSIAYHFDNVLQDVMANLNLKMGNILRKPLDGLVHYILHNILQVDTSRQSSVGQ